jgi:uncharacterized protein (DUF433 family)
VIALWLNLKTAVASVLLEWVITLQPNFTTAPNACSSTTASAITITTVNSIHTVSESIDKLEETTAYLSNLSYACWNVHTLRYEQSEILGGEPIIIGTRTSIRVIVGLWRLGIIPEEILNHLPHLTCKNDREQLEFAAAQGRCLLTHNRVDFERLHLQYMEECRQHYEIIIVPQKNAYEVAQRIGILVSTLMVHEIYNQPLYA